MIDLGDEMEFKRLPGATKDELTCNVADVPTDESNLVIKVHVSPLLGGAPGSHRRAQKGDSRRATCREFEWVPIFFPLARLYRWLINTWL